jgi:hypothetical protein
LFKEEAKKSAGGPDNLDKRKREALQEEIDDDGKVQ